MWSSGKGFFVRPDDYVGIMVARCLMYGITETSVTLRLSDRARAQLTEQAARRGQDIGAVASELIEQAVARPAVEQALAPFRRQVAASGLSDEELDDFFRREIEAHRQNTKAKST
jgi:hypothetical protein